MDAARSSVSESQPDPEGTSELEDQEDDTPDWLVDAERILRDGTPKPVRILRDRSGVLQPLSSDEARETRINLEAARQRVERLDRQIGRVERDLARLAGQTAYTPYLASLARESSRDSMDEDEVEGEQQQRDGFFFQKSSRLSGAVASRRASQVRGARERRQVESSPDRLTAYMVSLPALSY